MVPGRRYLRLPLSPVRPGGITRPAAAISHFYAVRDADSLSHVRPRGPGGRQVDCVAALRTHWRTAQHPGARSFAVRYGSWSLLRTSPDPTGTSLPSSAVRCPATG